MNKIARVQNSHVLLLILVPPLGINPKYSVNLSKYMITPFRSHFHPHDKVYPIRLLLMVGRGHKH